MAKKKTNYVIFKKESAGYPFPGEFWEEFTNLRTAKREFKNFDPVIFRLVKTTYEDMPNVALSSGEKK